MNEQAWPWTNGDGHTDAGTDTGGTGARPSEEGVASGDGAGTAEGPAGSGSGVVADAHADDHARGGGEASSAGVVTFPCDAPAEDIDGNPINGATIAPSDVLPYDVEHVSLEQALREGITTEAEVKAHLAGKVHVEATEGEDTPEEKERAVKDKLVYRCVLGHEQHGENNMQVTSAFTGQVIAQSGPVCVACQVMWFGAQFPTKLVPTEGMKAEARAKRNVKLKVKKDRVLKKLARKAAKKARRGKR